VIKTFKAPGAAGGCLGCGRDYATIAIVIIKDRNLIILTTGSGEGNVHKDGKWIGGPRTHRKRGTLVPKRKEMVKLKSFLIMRKSNGILTVFIKRHQAIINITILNRFLKS
jgi:hypothetical protein